MMWWSPCGCWFVGPASNLGLQKGLLSATGACTDPGGGSGTRKAAADGAEDAADSALETHAPQPLQWSVWNWVDGTWLGAPAVRSLSRLEAVHVLGATTASGLLINKTGRFEPQASWRAASHALCGVRPPRPRPAHSAREPSRSDRSAPCALWRCDPPALVYLPATPRGVCVAQDALVNGHPAYASDKKEKDGECAAMLWRLKDEWLVGRPAELGSNMRAPRPAQRERAAAAL
eukprot:3171238-Prymnesium_polylepis.1